MWPPRLRHRPDAPRELGADRRARVGHDLRWSHGDPYGGSFQKWDENVTMMEQRGGRPDGRGRGRVEPLREHGGEPELSGGLVRAGGPGSVLGNPNYAPESSDTKDARIQIGNYLLAGTVTAEEFRRGHPVFGRRVPRDDDDGQGA